MIYLVLAFMLLQVVCSQDIITTIAGSSTSGSYSGDGGGATSATLNNPKGVTLDSAGIFTISTCCIVCYKLFCSRGDPLLDYDGNYYSNIQYRQRVHR